jgi:hypothetical protein
LLDPAPQTSISDVTAFDTPERILAQVNGLYSGVKNAQLYGGRYTIYQELRADEFIMNKPNVQTGQLTWAHTVNSSTSEVQNMWSSAYGAINRIHLFLEGLQANKSKLSDAVYANYVGESKFLRALCYLVLVQQYARPYAENAGASPGVPIRLTAEKSAKNNDLARSTVKEVYAQIIADLNEAELKLPLNYATAALNTTRAHRNSAIALKTRVYLVQADYNNVIKEAVKIAPGTSTFQSTSAVANKLEALVVNVFTGSYTGQEAIFSLPMNAQDAPGGQNALSYYFTFNPGNGEYYLNTAGTDARKNLVITQQGQLWLYKYKTASPYIDYIPVIRYAEVLLNYAEAAAMMNDVSKSTALLNAVRKRSDAAYTFPTANVDTKDALVNTILTERKIELLGEGFRIPDLQRRLQPLPGKAGIAGSAPAVATTEAKYIWPIPANELSTNPLMIPNP